MYRTAISENFPIILKLTWGSSSVALVKSRIKIRYGTNPGQKAAFYVPKDSLWEHVSEVKIGKEGLSQTNICDVDRALRIIKYFDEPSCLVMKHLIPSGFATSNNEDLEAVYMKARDCDPIAAFGGVVILNKNVNQDTALEIANTFIEVVAAPGFDKESIEVLENKRDLRLLEYHLSDLKGMPKYVEDTITQKDMEFTSILDGAFFISEPLLTKIRTPEDMFVVTRRAPSESEYMDLIVSWYIGMGVRSNGIAISKNGCTLGIGAGQQDRVTAVRLALEKAVSRGHQDELKGAVLASDGFFPFKDSIDMAADYGIKAIAQPGGSVKDPEVIDACNERGIAMVFTCERAFGHF